jgi:hypothetical protein
MDHDLQTRLNKALISRRYYPGSLLGLEVQGYQGRTSWHLLLSHRQLSRQRSGSSRDGYHFGSNAAHHLIHQSARQGAYHQVID